MVDVVVADAVPPPAGAPLDSEVREGGEPPPAPPPQLPVRHLPGAAAVQLGHTVSSPAVRCSAEQYSAVHFSAVQCSAVTCSAVQCSAVRCSAVQYRAVMYIV